MVVRAQLKRVSNGLLYWAVVSGVGGSCEFNHDG